MNKTAIKNFAIWARNKLIADIQYRAGLMGITKEGIQEPLPQSTSNVEFYDIGTTEPYSIVGQAIQQRKRLASIIRQKEKDSDYSTAYKYILEEVAYTWFNRLIAIRFMEANDYLPSHIRVLSSESGKVEPDLVTTPFDAGLNFTPNEEQEVLRLKNGNKLDEAFRLLFIKQCNALNAVLPALFEQTSDYTELLLSLSVVDQDGVIYRLVHDIAEEDFNIEKGGQVEIIGWLYQYYNTEPKNAAFAKKSKITQDEIPAVTQLFTPDWIVRYMVENSLGRLWVEGHPNDELKASWKYYLEETPQEPEVEVKQADIRKGYADLHPEDIRIIDPCMGSGHILVYAFDVLIQIYESAGYSQRDAVQSILQHNLYGLDIDDRAAQLASFAVMMKARQYDRRILTRGLQPHVYAIAESNNVDADTLNYFTNGDSKLNAAMDSILHDLKDAKEYGSILKIKPVDFTALYARMEEVERDISFHKENVLLTILPLIRVAEILAWQYDTVITNPPYMGSANMDSKLSDFVKKYYPDSKSDLFAVFIERCGQLTKPNGYQAMITQHAWMFLSSFEKLRENLLLKDTINMAHLGPRAFEDIGGEVVQTTSFVLCNRHIANYKGTYCRLIDPTTQQGKENMFLSGENRYTAQQSNFSKIPGSPVAYWVGNAILSVFNNPTIAKISEPRMGLTTGNNDYYLRLWFEVSFNGIGFNLNRESAQQSGLKWFPYNKGGDYRKWYGNQEYVVNWQDDGHEMQTKQHPSGERIWAHNFNLEFNFKKHICWSDITTRDISFRAFGIGFLFDSSAAVTFVPENQYLYILGYLNTKLVKVLTKLLNPTMHFKLGDYEKLPYKCIHQNIVDLIVQKCLDISKSDWDSHETSWNFKRHPMMRLRMAGAYAWGDNPPVMRLSSAYKAWKLECDGRFQNLKSNEEELNRIFIDIYGLQNELTPEVADKDVTVHCIFDTKDDVPESMRGSNYVRTMQDEVVSLLSYAVGCMFGRYSLDVEGLAYAGGAWDAGKYTSFVPDKDGIIPITDEDYLEDDIIARLCDWLKAVYGSDTLEANLDFIAKALGGKGNSSREIIRGYFLKDFYKDHCKTYQKRPIYWLFDSGKQNGFKALIYLHRYTPDTIGNLRVDYLHKMQRVYESEIGRMQDMIDHSTSSREVAASTKRKEKLQKQLKECRDYDEKIAHLALSRIALNLDDGVKVNYRKVQTAADGKFYEVLADSKNIMGKEKNS